MAEIGDHIHPIIDTNTKNVNIELAGKYIKYRFYLIYKLF
jgi:REP element-mobilizing transposase RayT